jgi:hypothetical protein
VRSAGLRERRFDLSPSVHQQLAEVIANHACLLRSGRSRQTPECRRIPCIVLTSRGWLCSGSRRLPN